jgi:prepilin-type N-terminal cleavage/methylation domain-containing protein
MRRVRSAFTMIELIFVIVIMGIVGKFGVELLFQAYNYYLYNQADNRFQAQSEAAVQQIANRLQYRIPGSEIVRQSNAGLGNYTPIATTVDTNSSVTILEWVGYDIDGWRGDGNGALPTWSGFIDVAMTKANGSTPDLNTSETNATRTLAVWNALSNGTFNGAGAGLFFVQDTNFNVRDGFGWNGVAVADQTKTVHRVNIINGNNNRVTATVGNFSGQNIYEFYKLSWTAYALEHNSNTGELKLYYNYRPWNGETYANGTSKLLMENVDTFRFRSAGDAMKIQVCIRDAKLFQDNNGTGAFSICKEKTVF